VKLPRLSKQGCATILGNHIRLLFSSTNSYPLSWEEDLSLIPLLYIHPQLLLIKFNPLCLVLSKKYTCFVLSVVLITTTGFELIRLLSKCFLVWAYT
jgi:hypothetical protein